MTDSPPETAEKTTMPRALVWLLWSLVASVAAAFFPFPYDLSAGIAGIAVLVCAVIALFTIGTRRGSATFVMMLLSLGVGLVTVVSAAGVVVLFDEVEDYRQCVSQALTDTGRTQCDTTFEEAWQTRLGELGVPLPVDP